MARKTVVAVLADDAAQVRIAAAAGSGVDVIACASAQAAFQLCMRLPVDVLVVTARDSCGANTRSAVEALHRFDSRMLIIAYGRLDQEDVHETFELGASGACRLILRDREDGQARLRELLQGSRVSVGSAQLARRIQRLPNDRVRAVLSWLCRDDVAIPSVVQVAESFRVSRRSLFNWFRTASLRPPSEVIALFRLVRVATAALDDRRSFEHLAEASGFGSVASLRRSAVRRAGLRLRDFRSDRALALLATEIVPDTALDVSEPWQARADRGARGGEILLGGEWNECNSGSELTPLSTPPPDPPSSP